MPSNYTISMRKSNCNTKAISPPWKINSNTTRLAISSCNSKYQLCSRKDRPWRINFQPPNNKFIILHMIKTSYRKQSHTINHLSLQPINKSPLSNINCIKSTPKSLPINNHKPPSLTYSPKRTLSFTPFKLRLHMQPNSSNWWANNWPEPKVKYNCSTNNILEPKPTASNYPPNSSSTNRPSSNSTGTLSPLGNNFNSRPKRETFSTENSPKPSINSPIPLTSSPKLLSSSPKQQPNYSRSNTNLSRPKIPASIKWNSSSTYSCSKKSSSPPTSTSPISKIKLHSISCSKKAHSESSKWNANSEINKVTGKN